MISIIEAVLRINIINVLDTLIWRRSRNILCYGVLVGTSINSNVDRGKFIYDKHDKTLEVFLAHIVYADWSREGY